jgi:hypothetical protein
MGALFYVSREDKVTYINIHRKHILFRLSAMLLILLITPSASKNANLLKNPGFEDGKTSGWNTLGDLSLAVLTAPRTLSYSSLLCKAFIQREKYSGRGSISDTDGDSRVGYTDSFIMVDQRLLTKPGVIPPYHLSDTHVYVYDDNKIEPCGSALLLFDWLSRNNPRESSHIAN